MLLLNEVKAKPVQEATAGALVLFGVDIRRYVGLCVLASRDEAGEKALVLFSYQDGEQSFPAIYWPKVAGTLCLELGSALIVGDPTQLMDASPARAVSAGAISIDPTGYGMGYGITAHVVGAALRTWNLRTGALMASPQPEHVLLGCTIGVRDIDGKFVPLVGERPAQT